MTDIEPATTLVQVFPVVVAPHVGTVEVWRDGQWSYYVQWSGACALQPLPPILAYPMQVANYQAELWIAEQLKDCPHEGTTASVRLTDCGSGDWETITCLNCEQTISAGYI